jgi:hypothetical protein
MRGPFAVVLSLMLVACAGGPEPEPSPPPAPLIRYPVQPQPQANPDACNARPLQYLIGRPRTEIPVPVHPSMRQVVCTTCPRSETYSPMRQTILYDADTGLVREVRCG